MSSQRPSRTAAISFFNSLGSDLNGYGRRDQEDHAARASRDHQRTDGSECLLRVGIGGAQRGDRSGVHSRTAVRIGRAGTLALNHRVSDRFVVGLDRRGFGEQTIAPRVGPR